MTETFEPKPSGRLASSILWGGIGLVLIILAGAALLHRQDGLLRGTLEDELRPFGAVPDFALVERSGRQVTKNDLLGSVWVANFIFTRCVDECPLMSNQVARLQETFARKENLRWVSITLDPVHDTPEILAQYAKNFRADADRWWFLTGDKKAIYRLAQDGFHLAVFDPNEADRTSAVPILPDARRRIQLVVRNPLEAFVLAFISRNFTPASAWAHHGPHSQEGTRQTLMHSARFVLVDRQGRIRGYYDSREADDMRRLQRHIGYLLKEGA